MINFTKPMWFITEFPMQNRLISWKEYNENPIYKADDEVNGRPEMGRIYQIWCPAMYES